MTEKNDWEFIIREMIGSLSRPLLTRGGVIKKKKKKKFFGGVRGQGESQNGLEMVQWDHSIGFKCAD
jgi:hypothetical protein